MSAIDQEKSELFELAQERFIANDYRTAEILLQQLILSQKKNPHIFHMLGTIYYDQGKFNKAIRSFERALEIDPTFTDASVGLSIILNDLGRYEEGRKVFETAKGHLNKEDPQKSALAEQEEILSDKHFELGNLYLGFNIPKEALSQFLKAAHYSPSNVEIRMKVAETFFELGSTRKAIKELVSALKDCPQHLEARLLLGDLYHKTGRNSEAIDCWNSVLKRDPNNRACQQRLAQVPEKIESKGASAWL